MKNISFTISYCNSNWCNKKGENAAAKPRLEHRTFPILVENSTNWAICQPTDSSLPHSLIPLFDPTTLIQNHKVLPWDQAQRLVIQFPKLVESPNVTRTGKKCWSQTMTRTKDLPNTMGLSADWATKKCFTGLARKLISFDFDFFKFNKI